MNSTKPSFSFKNFLSFRTNSHIFIIIAALFFTFFQNIAFWKKTFELLPVNSVHDALFLASIFCFLVCALIIIFGVLCWRFTTKVILTFFLLASAATNYYALTYGIYMDRTMIANIFQTTIHEASGLITPRYILWMVIFGIIPTLLLWRTKITSPNKWWKAIFMRLVLILVAAAVLLATGLPFYKNYASFARNNREVIKLLTPSSYVVGLISYSKRLIAKNRPIEPIGLDAKISGASPKKTLFIFVVGETSRAQNFSLNGYARETNPNLKKYPDLINFKNVSSCGTATAVSVPCMFSPMGRDDYSASRAEFQENALDIIHRMGIYTYWRDNDSGCKGVCDRIANEGIERVVPETPENANDGLFYDDLLLTDLDKHISTQSGNVMILLHTAGSHGPTYYQRYRHNLPNLFQPSCDTKQIEQCDQQHLINVYDNTILGIDDMLNKTIQLLKGYEDKYDVAMLYLSDHGESLGENGIYLHGTPYAFAPKEQTHVPMIFWANPDFYVHNRINLACLKQKAQSESFSHDNVFHTLMGFWHIQTKELDPKLDIFSSCRTQ